MARAGQRYFCRSLFLFFLLHTSATAADQAYIHGVYVRNSPRAVALPGDQAEIIARTTATNLPGSYLLIGRGHSMNPLYPDGTILVVNPTPYANLARGMTVVYRKDDGTTVTHVLIAKAGDGWRARGLNNRGHDSQPVTADNLVGVVVQAFAPGETPHRSMLASSAL